MSSGKEKLKKFFDDVAECCDCGLNWEGVLVYCEKHQKQYVDLAEEYYTRL